VLLAKPHRLLLLQLLQVLPQLVKVQLQGLVPLARVQLQEKVERGVKGVVVNPALGVTTEMGDVTLRSPDYCLG
jgi:hypothetical protein